MTETQRKQAQPDAPDLEELARRLLDLWQDQLTAVAANPDLATQAARLMAAMPLPGMWLNQLGQMGQPGNLGGQKSGPDADMTKIWAKMTQDWMAQDWWKGTQGANSQGVRPGESRTGESGAGESRTGEPRTGEPGTGPAALHVQAGAAAAAAASGLGRGDLDELGRRLAGLEQRLGELAQHPAKPRRKSSSAKPKAAARKPRPARAADPGGGSGGADGSAAG